MRGPSKLGPQRVLPGKIVQRTAECECGLSMTFSFSYEKRSEIKAEYERIFGAHVRANHADPCSAEWKAAL